MTSEFYGVSPVNPEWNLDASANLVKLCFGRCLIGEMDAAKWTEVGLLTDTSAAIDGHPRLRRALHFGDDDYDACVHQLVPIVLGEQADPPIDPWHNPARPTVLTVTQRFTNLELVSDYLDFPEWLERTDPKMFARLFVRANDMGALLPDGTVLSAAETAASRLEVGEMRRQVDRIRRDYVDDPEAAVGQAKELIETTCKTILGMTGDADEVVRLPKLVSRTLLHLGLDPSQVTSDDGQEAEVRATKQVLGGVSSILTGANELRNARGTGHGRSGAPLVDPPMARLAVSLVLPVILFLVEAYEARATRPGEHEAPRSDRLSLDDLRVVGFVRHATFGVGTVLDVAGEGRQAVVTVDFGFERGVKRLLVAYAPLTLPSH